MSITVTLCPDCDAIWRGERSMCSCGNIDLEQTDLAEA
jgi:hypothetical protein